MPSSRKRNKGRDRKAKKAALEAEQAALEVERMERERGIVRNRWKSWARGVDIYGQVIQCNHGVDLMIPDDNHPITSFMDALFTYAAHDRLLHTGRYLVDTFTAHQEVWDNERYRETAVKILITIGTNFTLSSDRADCFLAHTIVALENYDGLDIGSTLNCRVVAAKRRDLLGSNTNRRDELKFFRKRTSCKCLKGMHLDARKSFIKVGVCQHCAEVKERALLMVCIVDAELLSTVRGSVTLHIDLGTRVIVTYCVHME